MYTTDITPLRALALVCSDESGTWLATATGRFSRQRLRAAGSPHAEWLYIEC
jgi:hypothetical protein